MRKIKVQKITMLFLLVLCILSSLIIGIRHMYLESKQKEIKESVIKRMENQIDGEEEIFTNGIVGMIIIPSLGVEAPIYEGTTGEVLKYTVRTF